jgi:hypothetical protein
MEKIPLMGTLGKNLKWIKKTDYERFYDFIMEEVMSSPGIQLQELVDRCSGGPGKQFPANFSWILLQVKHDMEARGIIQTNLDRMRNQIITVRDNRSVFQSIVSPKNLSVHGL